MAVLAVLLPLLMLGVVLALGWYEDLLLPARHEPRHDEGADRREPAGAPRAAVAAATQATAADRKPPAPHRHRKTPHRHRKAPAPARVRTTSLPAASSRGPAGTPAPSP